MGPSSLITTSTRSLAHQLGTRVLEVPIRDDADQTRDVMGAHAEDVMEDDGLPDPDLKPFIAVQRWLTAAGEPHVVVPFAAVLAEQLPPGQVRMRRDFRQLLTAIQAVAYIY